MPNQNYRVQKVNEENYETSWYKEEYRLVPAEVPSLQFIEKFRETALFLFS